MQKLTLTVLGVLVIALTGCSVSSTSGVMKPGQSKSGFMGLSKTAEVQVVSPKTLKKQTDKIVIGSFKVGFLTQNKARAVAKGGYFSNASAGKASAMVTLNGITTEQMQQIANETYQNFVAELQAKGYTVLGPAELASEPAYAALQNTSESDVQPDVVMNIALNGKTTYVAPEGQKVVFFLGEKKSAFNISMDTLKKAQALSEATGAGVLTVNYIVNFVNAESHGGFTSTASVKVGQGLSTVIGSNATLYINKDMPATIKLGQAVFSMEEFGTIDETTTGGGKALQTATNVATALLGGGTSIHETYSIIADPAKYTAAALEVTNNTNKKLIEKLVEGKMPSTK